MSDRQVRRYYDRAMEFGSMLASTITTHTTITDRRHRPLSNSALNSKPKTNISASDQGQREEIIIILIVFGLE